MRTPHFRRDDVCGTRRSAASEREDVMRTALFLLSTAAVALAAIPAQAQTADPADEAATGADDNYGEILVTAQRRSESVQDVKSEEHTSELQSLMRISYAVFCLKKKTKQHTKKAN